MPIAPGVTDLQPELVSWRHDLHAHPELAFKEHRTSDFVASKLAQWGLEVHRGLADTGVVGVLKGREGHGNSIGLRADMDALPIQERNEIAHKSQHSGVMHACGHDGHTTMLLGAARHLAETRGFAGTVFFIFQPAEERGGEQGGGARMLEDGLFERFDPRAVYGLHNWPGLPVGQFAVGTGPMMASGDSFEIRVSGRGSHAAQPHAGVDPLVTASHLVLALQTIVSRNADPLQGLVVSATQIHGGDAYNVLPDDVIINGTVRAFLPDLRAAAEPALRRVVDGVCAAMGATATVRYARDYPTVVNMRAETTQAAAAAGKVFGDGNVEREPPQTMIVEDFAFMLQQRPGCYAWIGNGTDDGRILHSARYDFNDEILPLGVSYWIALVESVLALGDEHLRPTAGARSTYLG